MPGAVLKKNWAVVGMRIQSGDKKKFSTVCLFPEVILKKVIANNI